MKLEQTIQYMYDFCPDLYPNRQHALNHLFLTIGNGMVWHDGQLIDKDFENLDYNNEVMHDCHFGNNYKITVPEVTKAQQDPLATVNFINRVLKYDPNYKFKWYRQNDNNEIIISMNCPPALITASTNKVNADWQAGIDEVYEMLRNDKIKLKYV
jgi:hypothetical protein